MDDNESITDISESNLLLDSREEKESQPSPTTINISNTTTTNSSEAPIPQLAKSRATSEVHIQTNITESEIDAVSNRRSPLKIHTETYNNDKDHTAGSQIFICSLPVKPATMVVHIMSVAFVVAVAIVMKTGTSMHFLRCSSLIVSRCGFYHICTVVPLFRSVFMASFLHEFRGKLENIFSSLKILSGSDFLSYTFEYLVDIRFIISSYMKLIKDETLNQSVSLL